MKEFALPFKFTNATVILPLFWVLLLWVVYWVQIKSDFDFYTLGILPRTFSGLQGVLFASFIHADLGHLYNNSVPLFLFLMALHFFYRNLCWRLIVYGLLFSGIFTWIIGRDNYHIGASSFIYVLFSFLFLRGLVSGFYRLVAVSLCLIVVYGGMFWYIFPEIDVTISWEGHLSGLLGGAVLALKLKDKEWKPLHKYPWEAPDYDASKDVFMQHFDVFGNFVSAPKEEEKKEFSFFTPSCNVVYEWLENNESEPEE